MSTSLPGSPAPWITPTFSRVDLDEAKSNYDVTWSGDGNWYS